MSDQFAEWDKFYAGYEKTVTVSGAMQSYRNRKAKDDAKKNDVKTGPGRAGLSLASHHAKLNEEGYVPPPPVEVPFEYAGRHRSTMCKLSDEDVIWCRENPDKLSVADRARRFGVNYMTMNKAVQGHSYKHLNIRKPVAKE